MKFLLKYLSFAIALSGRVAWEFEEVPLDVSMIRGYWKATESDTYTELWWNPDDSYGCDIWQWNGVKSAYVLTETYPLVRRDSLSLGYSVIEDDVVMSSLTFTMLDRERMMFSRSAPNRPVIEMEFMRVSALPAGRIEGKSTGQTSGVESE